MSSLASSRQVVNRSHATTSTSRLPEFSTIDAHLSTLEEVTSLELRCLTLAAASKTCEIDPVPAFLIQELIDELLPFLALLSMRLIQEAHTSQKRSILLPAVKRDGLDSSDPATVALLHM